MFENVTCSLERNSTRSPVLRLSFQPCPSCCWLCCWWWHAEWKIRKLLRTTRRNSLTLHHSQNYLLRLRQDHGAKLRHSQRCVRCYLLALLKWGNQWRGKRLSSGNSPPFLGNHPFLGQDPSSGNSPLLGHRLSLGNRPFSGNQCRAFNSHSKSKPFNHNSCFKRSQAWVLLQRL